MINFIFWVEWVASDWSSAEPRVGPLCDSSPGATHHAVQEAFELSTAAGSSSCQVISFLLSYYNDWNAEKEGNALVYALHKRLWIFSIVLLFSTVENFVLGLFVSFMCYQRWLIRRWWKTNAQLLPIFFVVFVVATPRFLRLCLFVRCNAQTNVQLV